MSREQELVFTVARLDTALRLVEADPHQWSKRPCSTCRNISRLLERPFGCEAKNVK